MKNCTLQLFFYKGSCEKYNHPFPQTGHRILHVIQHIIIYRMFLLQPSIYGAYNANIEKHISVYSPYISGKYSTNPKIFYKLHTDGFLSFCHLMLIN